MLFSGQDPNVSLSFVLIACVLAVICGALLKVKTDPVKVFLSCVAATAAAGLAFVFGRSMIVNWAMGAAVGILGGKSPEQAAAELGMQTLAMLVVMVAIWLAVFALCLVLIAELPRLVAVGMATFAAGGCVAFSVLYLLAMTPLASPMMPSNIKTPFYIAGLIGAALLFAGYSVGMAGVRQSTSFVGYEPVPVPADLMPTVGSISISTMSTTNRITAQPENRPTQRNIATVLHDAKSVGSTLSSLTVIGGPARGSRFDLSDGEVRIGRASTCGIKIADDDEVGREHALIRFESGRHILHDLASRNGTFLNDQRVTEPRQLMTGDRIRFGTATVVEFTKVGA